MKYVDLTLRITDGMVTNPAHIRTSITDQVAHWFTAPRFTPPCRGYSNKLMLLSDHTGTHFDAPHHFIEGAKTIEEVPLDRTFGKAVLIDVSEKAPDKPVEVEMLVKRLALTNTQIEPDDIVLIRSWPGEWGGPGFFEAAGISEEAAKWLAAQKVKCVGVNLANIDTGSDMRRPSHMEFLGKEIGIIENLTNLDKLSQTRFFFMGLPLNFAGLTASPIRAVAIEEW